MNKTNINPANETTPPTFKKKIGRTTYEVSVHFNPNARETLHKKTGKNYIKLCSIRRFLVTVLDKQSLKAKSERLSLTKNSILR